MDSNGLHGILFVVIANILSTTQGAPTLSVDENPSNYSSSATLRCSDSTYVSGNGFSWKKNGITIFNNAGEATTNGKYSGDIDGKTLKLLINDLVAADEDSYVCNHAFFDSNQVDLEVESRGTVAAKLSSSDQLEVSFKQIYPNSTSVVITCGANTVDGYFESSVKDGDRFTNTWKSNDTYSTVPSSCTASVTLTRTFNTAFTVISVVVPIIVVLLLLWHKIVIAISCYLLGSFGSGMILGLNVIKTTCCCACFYEGESCEDCVSNNCECKCCDETPCGACFNIKRLPSWYKILWLSIIGSPVAFGMWVAMKCCGQGNKDTSKNAVGTGSNKKNAETKLLERKKPSKSPGKADDVNREKPASVKQNQHADQAHKVENEGKKPGRDLPPPPVGANPNREGSGSVVSGRDVEMHETDTSLNRSQLPTIHTPGHDNKGRGLSANFGDDDHPLVAIDIPAQKAGALPTIVDTPRETKKKTKKKKKDKQEDNQKTETVLDF